MIWATNREWLQRLADPTASEIGFSDFEPVLVGVGDEDATLELWQVDPSRGLLIEPARGGKVIGLTRGNWLIGQDVTGNVEYILQKVPAGTYYLAFVDWGDHGRSAIAGGSIQFTVKPGAAAYVGDYAFETPWTVFSDVKLKVLPRNPVAAGNFLAQYPRLAAPLWDQQPLRLALPCKLDMRPEKACFAPA